MLSTDIVFLGMHDWRAIPQRSRHLATEMATNHRVFYINPVYYSAPGYIRDVLKGKRLREKCWGVEQVTESLYIMSLPPLFPKGPLYPNIGHLNYSILLPLIRMLLRQFKINNPILWMSTPPDQWLIGRLGEKFSIYDCMDRHSLFFTGRISELISEEEKQMLKRVNLVIASSNDLHDHCAQYNSNVHVVRNGVNPHIFSVDYRAEDDPLQSIPSPRIGYIGYLGPWLDTELLQALARAYPHTSIVLVGPIGTGVEMLRQHPNIHLLGEQHYSKLTPYIRDFDVCIIPFRVNDLTKAVNPIKLYEYLALGKPVVSSALPELEGFQDITYISYSNEEFLANITAALHEVANPDQSQQQRRIHLAFENSWYVRARQIDQIIQNHENLAQTTA